MIKSFNLLYLRIQTVNIHTCIKIYNTTNKTNKLRD